MPGGCAQEVNPSASPGCPSIDAAGRCIQATHRAAGARSRVFARAIHVTRWQVLRACVLGRWEVIRATGCNRCSCTTGYFYKALPFVVFCTLQQPHIVPPASR